MRCYHRIRTEASGLTKRAPELERRKTTDPDQSVNTKSGRPRSIDDVVA